MELVEELEQRIERLRVAVREAVIAGDREHARALRADLRHAEQAWEDALAEIAESAADRSLTTQDHLGSAPSVIDETPGRGQAGGKPVSPLLPLREQVHEALSLLAVPAAPKLIAAVHEAFFGTVFSTVRVTSLRRDEERSFRSAPFARPYYICSALTADLLAPARGLLGVSTWNLERRVIGPLSSRVNFLMAAMNIADACVRIPDSDPAPMRLLWRFAVSIPGAVGDAAGRTGRDAVEPSHVIRAARAELTVHEAADRGVRRSAAERARRQLDDVAQLFGTRLRTTSQRSSG